MQHHHAQSSPSANARGVMERLREETAAHHSRAEKHPFQRALVSGGVERELYGAWLGQMFLVHAALERLIDRARSQFVHTSVVRDEHRHTERLRKDLESLGMNPEGLLPLDGAARLIDGLERIAARNPLDLLGSHYVLEGSMNGNKYIAMAVRKRLALAPGSMDNYLDPYGDRQREVWAGFKADMGALDLTEPQIDSIIDAAKIVFEGVSWISEDLMPTGEEGAVSVEPRTRATV